MARSQTSSFESGTKKRKKNPNISDPTMPLKASRRWKRMLRPELELENTPYIIKIPSDTRSIATNICTPGFQIPPYNLRIYNIVLVLLFAFPSDQMAQKEEPCPPCRRNAVISIGVVSAISSYYMLDQLWYSQY